MSTGTSRSFHFKLTLAASSKITRLIAGTPSAPAWHTPPEAPDPLHGISSSLQTSVCGAAGRGKRWEYDMYAVIKTGGKQYRVAADDVLKVEKLDGNPGAAVQFGEVLMLGGTGSVTVGKPTVSGASVTAEILEQGRGPKLINFKKRRRKNSRRKKGHRQDLTTVRIMEVLGAGQKASKELTGVGVKARRFRGSGRRFELLKSAEGGQADDLSLIGGVGPKFAEELHKAGIFHLWQIAALTKQNVEALEAKGQFSHRIQRDEWVMQAQELLDGKPPRAKIDRDHAATSA